MKLTLRILAFAFLLGTISFSTATYADETPAGGTLGGGGVVMDRSLQLQMWVQVLDENGYEVLFATADNASDALDALPQGSYTLNYVDANGEIIASTTLEK